MGPAPVPPRADQPNRLLAVLVGLWALLVQAALPAYHHHEILGPEVLARIAVVALPDVPGSHAADDDGQDCVVCQAMHGLGGFLQTRAFHWGHAAEPAGTAPLPALALVRSSAPRLHVQPRAPPSAV